MWQMRKIRLWEKAAVCRRIFLMALHNSGEKVAVFLPGKGLYCLDRWKRLEAELGAETQMYQLSFFPGRTGIQTQNRNGNNDCDNLKMASCHAIHPSNGNRRGSHHMDCQSFLLMTGKTASRMHLVRFLLPHLQGEIRTDTGSLS